MERSEVGGDVDAVREVARDASAAAAAAVLAAPPPPPLPPPSALFFLASRLAC